MAEKLRKETDAAKAYADEKAEANIVLNARTATMQNELEAMSVRLDSETRARATLASKVRAARFLACFSRFFF
eukprot:1176393-Prorocentrum_minimum.AAC.6